jgi:hypothetical protein
VLHRLQGLDLDAWANFSLAPVCSAACFVRFPDDRLKLPPDLLLTKAKGGASALRHGQARRVDDGCCVVNILAVLRTRPFRQLSALSRYRYVRTVLRVAVLAAWQHQ